MMQHIATAKTEVAAFSKETGADALASSASNDQFDKILQEQKSHNAPINNHQYIPSPSSVKNESKVTVEAVKKDSSRALKEDAAPEKDESTTIKSAGKVSSGKLDEQTEDASALSDKSKLGSTDQDSAPDEHYCPYGHAGETDAKLKLSSDVQEEATVPVVKADNVLADEWIELVGNLQKLSNEAESDTPLTTDVNVVANLDDLSGADLDIESRLDISQSIVEQPTEEYVAETVLAFIQLAADEVRGETEIQGDVEAEVQGDVEIEVQDDVSSAGIGATEQITLDVDVDVDVDSARVQQKTVEMLLERPDVLQALAVNLDSGDQDNQVTEPVDITTDENKALLTSLLLAPELVESEFEQTTVQASAAILDSKVDSGLVNQVQTEQKQAVLLGSEPEIATEVEISEQISEQITEQDIVQEVAVLQPSINTAVDSVKADKMVKNADIKVLINLPENKLDRVLVNIAQQVLDKSPNESTTSEQVQVIQQVGNARAADIISSNDLSSSTKEFVGALKSGLEEFKNQLAQGREPGIDLKSLVTDALSKSGDETALSTTSTTKVASEQLVNGISQVLNFANSLNQAIEQNQNQTYNAALRDVTQIQGEQTKQAQLAPFESKFEKAVNIAKPEGHQQLAEKVRWMVNTKNLVAEIRLDPAELGSMHVKVAVSGESATVNFVVQSQQARDAVDTATPRLKEMLADKGIELGQSSVEQESRGQQQGESESSRGNNTTNTSAEEVELAQQGAAQQKIVNGALGGIDYFV